MSTTLYERIGGEDAVKATVLKMYEKILRDDRLAEYFEHVDVDKLRRKQSAFVTMAFGGPHEYEGRDLRTAHAKLVKSGLSDTHFNAVAEHLQSAMLDLNVPQDLIDEALAIVGATRNDVLNR